MTNGATEPARIARRGALAVVALPFLGLSGCEESKPAAAVETVLRTERLGPPGWVSPGAGQAPQVWVLVRQTLGGTGSAGGAGGAANGTRQRIDLHAFDSVSTGRRWSRRLRVRSDLAAGSQVQARLLGQEGEHVWLFVDGQPVRLAAQDGAVRGMTAEIEEAVPFLRTRLPRTLDAYAFDQGLVVWLEGAPRWRIHGSTLRASGYMPPSEDHVRTIRWLSQTWPGGFETRSFGVRQGSPSAGGPAAMPMLSLYADRELADATRAGARGPVDPEGVLREDGRPERRLRLWTPGVRLPAVPRGSGAYRDGAFLVRQGTREPLLDGDPPAAFVLHRDPAGDALLLDRVGLDGHAQWQAPVGLAELTNRWQLEDRLVLYGPSAAPSGPDAMPDMLVSIRRSDGTYRQQRLQDAAMAPPMEPAASAPR